jgi:hypothetical protein
VLAKILKCIIRKAIESCYMDQSAPRYTYGGVSRLFPIFFENHSAPNRWSDP